MEESAKHTTLEQELAEALKARDKKAIVLIHENYSPTLYGVALQIVHTEHIAEVVIQEAFIKIWKNADKYDSAKGRVFTWILNIVRNTAIDHIRSKAYKQEVQRGQNPVSNYDGIGNNETQVDHIGLKSIMEKLTPDHRQILDLVYFNGYTQKEVAEELNMPLGTVKSKIRNSIIKLRKIFK